MGPSNGQSLNSEFSSKLLYYTNSTKNTSNDVTQHVSMSSQALEGKQGKYHDEVDQGPDHLECKIKEKCFAFVVFIFEAFLFVLLMTTLNFGLFGLQPALRKNFLFPSRKVKKKQWGLD